MIIPTSRLGVVAKMETSGEIIQLLDRLMPEIIKRIDVKFVLPQRPGQTAEVKPGSDPFERTANTGGKASCLPGETAVSAGFTYTIGGGTDISLWTVKRIPNSNTWYLHTNIDDGYGKFFTYAECLKVQLSLRQVSAQQPGSLGYLQEIPQPPAKPQPPSQPPGGPPLRPPPEFGK